MLHHHPYVSAGFQIEPQPSLLINARSAFVLGRPSYLVEHEIFHNTQLQLRHTNPLEAWAYHVLELEPETLPEDARRILKGYVRMNEQTDHNSEFVVEEAAAQLHTALAIRALLEQKQAINTGYKKDNSLEESRACAQVALHLAAMSIRFYQSLIEELEEHPEDTHYPIKKDDNRISLTLPSLGKMHLPIGYQKHFFELPISEFKRTVVWLTAYRDFIINNPSLTN